MGSLDLKKPKDRELLGGDLLAQSLHALGVRVAFGLHGQGFTRYFVNTIANRDDTLVILMHFCTAVSTSAFV